MLQQGNQQEESLRSDGIGVVSNLEAAHTMLRPLRLKILDLLSSPESATGLARRLKMPRQRLNYHLRELEGAGLLELVKSEGQGNCVERFYQSTSRYFLLGPEILGKVAPPDPPALSYEGVKERFSWAYVVKVLGKALRDLSVLRRRADQAGKHLATFGLHTEVRFVSPAAVAEFAEELTDTVARLSAKYHAETSATGRAYTFFLGSYPTITPAKEMDGSGPIAN